MGGILEKLAHELLTKAPEQLKTTTVVVPTRRAALFLKKYLLNNQTVPGWLPKLTTLNEFAAELSQITVADNLVLSVELFSAYQQVFGAEANNFDHFLTWCPSLLKDFSDVDAYMLDPDIFFKDLFNYKELEDYSISNAEAFSPGQQREINFWKKLGAMYRCFAKIQEEKKIGVAGFVNKKAAEKASEVVPDWKGFTYFVGFNALSASERHLITQFETNGKGVLWLDCDSYYTRDNLNEAGFFIRQLQKQKIGTCIENGRSIATTPRQITIAASNSSSSQGETVGAVLNNLSPQQLEKTVVVLCDESLLLPVLNKIPNTIEAINITMGSSLKDSMVYDFIAQYFELHSTSMLQNSTLVFYYRRYLALVQHPLLTKLYSHKTTPDEIADFLRRKNQIYIDPAGVKDFFKNDPQVHEVLSPFWRDNKSLNFTEVIGLFLSFFETLLAAASENDDSPIEAEEVFQALQACRVLHVKLVENHISDQISEPRTIQAILQRSIALSKVSFIGEPIFGLQLMGLLETRALQFDTVILVSANEGIIPPATVNDSFFPLEIRKHHKLPGRREREAVTAYHFYRLFQGCEEAIFIYNNNTELDGSGEPSRYISQLEYELPEQNPAVRIKYLRSKNTVDLGITTKEITKSPEVIEQIKLHLVSGLSPSSINNYLRCPLNWYHKYIARISDREEVEEEISPATLGTVVHEVLERLYTPFLNQNLLLGERDIEKFILVFEDYAKEAFQKNHSNSGYRHGANFAIYRKAIEMLNRFFNVEKQALANGKSLQILGLEKEFRRILPLELPGETLPLTIKGKIDRIDGWNNTVRVVDYKTGGMEASDVKLTEKLTHDLISNPKKSTDKMLQLLLYKWLCEDSFTGRNVSAGIISLLKPSSGIIELNIDMDNDWNENLQATLRTIALEMLNPAISLTHLSTAQYCDWC